MFDLKGNVIINLYCTQHPQKREKTKDDSYFIQVIILHTGFTALIPNPPLWLKKKNGGLSIYTVLFTVISI